MIALAVGVLTLIAPTAGAATSTFLTSADARVQEGNPSTNYGTSTNLRVDAGNDPDVETYLRFMVSGLSGSIQSVKLRLFASTGTANGPAVYTTANTWTEAGITWSSRTPRVGAATDDKGSLPSGAWVEFDVTSLVTGEGTFNFVLAGTSSDGIDFHSREATNKPQLVVTTGAVADTEAPTAPSNLTASAAGPTRVDLSWTASDDNVSVSAYDVYRNGSLLASVPWSATTHVDSTADPATSYTYEVKARDAAGNVSGPSNPAAATTPADTQAPTDPTGLTATAAGPTQADLTWSASTDDVRVTAYDVYRDGLLFASVGGTQTSYSDTTAFPVATYSYRLKARDAAGNESGFSNAAAVTMPPASDTEGPSRPTDLTATAVSSTLVELSWTASTDNILVTGYRIYRDGSFLKAVGDVTSASDATVSPSGTYTYELTAVDDASNESLRSAPADVTTPADTQAPTNPTNLTATAASSTRVDLSWTAPTDDVGVTGYEIYRDGALLATLGTATAYSDTTTAPGTAYGYQVRAFDAAANRSAFSVTATVTTPEQTGTFNASADARVQEANATTNYGTSATLRVDAGADPDVESYLLFNVAGLSGSVNTAKLRVFASTGTVNGPAAYATGTSWSETGITWSTRPARTSGPADDKGAVTSGTWLEFNVTSLVPGNGAVGFVLAGTSSDGVDFHSKEGANKPQLVVTTGAPDTQTPSAPTDLRVTVTTSNRVDLAWNASTDNTGVTGYDIYRGGSLLIKVGAVTSYSDSTVLAGTTYSYQIKSRDAAGNVSEFSSSVSATTPSGSDPIVAAVGDIACSTSDANYNGGAGTATACRQRYTSDVLVGAGYAAVLPLGDNQYNSGSLSSYNAVYDPTWGRVKSITRPVPGNHDYSSSTASGYYGYFGAAAGDPSKGYYSFNVGSWHIVALNSNCTKISGGCDVGSPQEQWLRADLAANPTACTLAYSHHARYSSGHDGDNLFVQAMWKALNDAGAELLLSGHSHNYERFAPQNAVGGRDDVRGVRQFVVGTGGAFFTGVSSAHANSQVRNNTTFGVLKLTLHPHSYDWAFIPEAGKTFTDSGSTSCH